MEYCTCACMLSLFSHVQLLATLWTVARQAPLSMGFSRQEHWNVLPFPSPITGHQENINYNNNIPIQGLPWWVRR